MNYEDSTEGGCLASETKNTNADLRTTDLITGTDIFFLKKT